MKNERIEQFLNSPSLSDTHRILFVEGNIRLSDREIFLSLPKDLAELIIRSKWGLAEVLKHNKIERVTVFTRETGQVRTLRSRDCQRSQDFRKLKLLKQQGSIMSINDKNLQFQPFQTNIPGVGEVTFAEFFQFLSEESRKGCFWMIHEEVSDRVLFLTDNAEPGRLVMPTNQYIGANRRDAFRDSMQEREQLGELLAIEKTVPSFEINCYRPDNSFVHLQKSFFLIEGLFGTQCRASCSEGWELLKPAPDVK